MADDRGLQVVLHADEETWTIDLFDFTGTDWKQMKQRVPGLTMAGAVAGLDTLDAEVLAVLMWRWRIKDEPDLTFEHCLDSISLRSVLRKPEEPDEEPVDASDPSD